MDDPLNDYRARLPVMTDDEWAAWLNELVECCRCGSRHRRRLFPKAMAHGSILYFRRWCVGCLRKYVREYRKDVAVVA